jgi:hypothetical protein
MNLIRQFVISSTLLLAIAQPSLAVQARNQIAPSPAGVSSTGIVERGGTVDAVDLAKKTIVVDNVKYALTAMPVKIHAPAGKGDEKAFQLKAGMQILFNTSKANYAAQDQVSEIWVTSVGGKPAKR